MNTAPSRFSVSCFALFCLCLAAPMEAFANDIIINSSTSGPVYGNSSNQNGSLNDQTPSSNTLTINAAVTGTGSGGNAYGGYASGSSNAMNNMVTINNGGSVEGSVGGGVASGTGNATGNTVTIDGGSVGGTVGGGAAYGSAGATGNSVVINAGSIGGYVYGGFGGGGGSATGNIVTINGGTISSDIYGGEIASGSGPATGNTVIITTTSGSYRNIYGGHYQIGHSGNADLFTNNTLSLAAGNTILSVQNMATLNFTSGGNAGIGTLDTTATGVGGAPLVTVNTDTHAINFSGAITGTGGIDKTGTGTLTLTGANTYSGMTTVSAGTLALTGSGTIGAGGLALYDNTTFDAGSYTTALPRLDVHGGATYTGNLNAANGNLNFYLPTTLSSGATMLTVSGTADITGSTANVGIEGGSSPLKAGDSVVLINAGTLTGAPANTTANGQGMQGVTLLYDFDLLAQGNQLLATVTSIGVNPQLKSLSEGRAAGMAFVNQGSDLMLGSGMGAMLAATQGTTGRGPAQGGFAPFAAGSGGWSRYNTGSHVDVSGVSIMTGLAWRQPVNEGKNGSVLAGAFFEAGWGNYDSHNSFNNAASVKGDGDISYYGGGILGRYDFAPAIFMNGSGNFYVDASFRAGHVSTDFSSSDLIDSTGRKADYDSGSAYYGAHAGLGYLWNITERASLDLSTRYIWTHQNSDTVKVLGDPVKFKASDSQRWRTGARFAYAVNECIAPYVGAYYDHEFDGKARASTNGYAIDAPDLAGGTGVGELGFTLQPSQTLPLSFDLGVQGYTGVREGVTGSLQVKWEF